MSDRLIVSPERRRRLIHNLAADNPQMSEEEAAELIDASVEVHRFATAGPLTTCRRCGSSDGLKPARDVGGWLIVSCRCNYQHVLMTNPITQPTTRGVPR